MEDSEKHRVHYSLSNQEARDHQQSSRRFTVSSTKRCARYSRDDISFRICLNTKDRRILTKAWTEEVIQYLHDRACVTESQVVEGCWNTLKEKVTSLDYDATRAVVYAIKNVFYGMHVRVLARVSWLSVIRQYSRIDSPSRSCERWRFFRRFKR
jgi:hypothetical protein